ncbi:MAG: hypothetical protein M1470_00465 [Bacteroidetes bacterium]|nr:hypothetical protein [Bacteroidota bacterium]MCL5737223.1 hypothetical protein [Bacteroidota bacterium]
MKPRTLSATWTLGTQRIGELIKPVRVSDSKAAAWVRITSHTRGEVRSLLTLRLRNAHITGKSILAGRTNFWRNKKSRKSDRLAGIWSGVDEARTRDLLRDRKNYTANMD